jgi:hypothetical protein
LHAKPVLADESKVMNSQAGPAGPSAPMTIPDVINVQMVP